MANLVNTSIKEIQLMFKFIKNLFGFGEPQETVKEILTPPKAPYKIEPAPQVAVATTPAKTPNKNRRPYRGNKPKAKPAVTEGNTKGGSGAVKPAQVAKVKSQTPAPKKK